MPDEKQPYDPLLTQKLLRAAEANKHVPQGEVITLLAKQMAAADAEISAIGVKLLNADQQVENMKRERAVELQEMREFRERAAAVDVPAPLILTKERRKTGKAAETAPKGTAAVVIQHPSNPFMATGGYEAPAPVSPAAEKPKRGRKAQA